MTKYTHMVLTQIIRWPSRLIMCQQIILVTHFSRTILYWATSLRKTLVREKECPLNYSNCSQNIDNIKHEVSPIPCLRYSSTLQSLKPVGSISEHLHHMEWASPFGRQLILQLVRMSLSHN